MKILIYYPKKQTTFQIEADQIEVGPGGLTWVHRGRSGFVIFGACADYQLTILSN